MYTLLQTERLNVKPGITGLWQVSARDSKNFDERLLWDVKYVEKISLWLDVQIIWRTIAQVLRRNGV
jgi:lipopolysaccharide/colanic/teichoic acid biosynthesis glycosyltransferase